MKQAVVGLYGYKRLGALLHQMNKSTIKLACFLVLIVINSSLIAYSFIGSEKVLGIVLGFHWVPNTWFSQQLHLLGEKSLREADSHSYRFTYIPSFDQPFTIRVDVRANGEGKLRHCVAATVQGFGRRIRLSSSKKISRSQVEGLLRILDENFFWELPREVSVYGLDGSTWIVEGIKDGAYHVVGRWEPEMTNEKAVFALGTYFMDLAGKPSYSISILILLILAWAYLFFGTPILLILFLFALIKKLRDSKKNGEYVIVPYAGNE